MNRTVIAAALALSALAACQSPAPEPRYNAIVQYISGDELQVATDLTLNECASRLERYASRADVPVTYCESRR